LVNLDSCELIRSQFDLVSDYCSGLALDFLAEVSEQLLPAAEPNEKFFRLLVSMLDSLRAASLNETAAARAYRAVTYFALWAVRLAGWLPELHVCLGCGSVLDDPHTHAERAFYTRGRAGLVCQDCRRTARSANFWELTAESRLLASEMLRTPILQLSRNHWSQNTAADLRRFLVQQIESHAERRLVTARMMEEMAAVPAAAAI